MVLPPPDEYLTAKIHFRISHGGRVEGSNLRTSLDREQGWFWEIPVLERIKLGPVDKGFEERRRMCWKRSKLLSKVPVVLQLLLRSELLLVKPEGKHLTRNTVWQPLRISGRPGA